MSTATTPRPPTTTDLTCVSLPNKNGMNPAYIVVDKERGGETMDDTQTTNRSDKSDTMSGSKLIADKLQSSSTTSLRNNNIQQQQHQNQQHRPPRLLPIDWSKRAQQQQQQKQPQKESSDDEDVVIVGGAARRSSSSSKIRNN